jgi:hypothetical protein
VVKAGYLKGTGSNSLGTGNIIVDGSFAVPASLINPATVLSNGPAWFEVNYDLDTRGTLTLGNNAQMILHQNVNVGGLTINGTNVPNGTYTYAQLAAQYPSSFAPGGSGSIKVNSIIGIGIPANRAVRAPLAAAGGSLRGEYWKRPVFSIATDGTTNPTNRVDEQIKRFGSPSGTFSARSFVYLGNDLTPVTNWLAGDGASFVGPTNNLDDAGFRFTGFLNITNPTVVNIGLNSDDGSRLKIGGVDIIDNDGGHGDQTRDTNITFQAAGLYPIEITYFNGDWTDDTACPNPPVPNHSTNCASHGGANFHLRLNGADITAAGSVDSPSAQCAGAAGEYCFHQLPRRGHESFGGGDDGRIHASAGRRLHGVAPRLWPHGDAHRVGGQCGAEFKYSQRRRPRDHQPVGAERALPDGRRDSVL